MTRVRLISRGSRPWDIESRRLARTAASDSGLYVRVRRVSIMSSPVQQAESLGQRDRVNRSTGGRKAAQEEATGSSQKRREAGANQATAPRDPRGKARAELLEAQS